MGCTQQHRSKRVSLSRNTRTRKAADRTGQAVLRLKPTVAVLSSAELISRCSACALSLHELAIGGQDVKALKRCTLCKVVHYCSVVSGRSCGNIIH